MLRVIGSLALLASALAVPASVNIVSPQWTLVGTGQYSGQLFHANTTYDGAGVLLLRCSGDRYSIGFDTGLSWAPKWFMASMRS